MAGLDGRAVADALPPHHPELLVLQVSGYTQDAMTHAPD